jgi:hypothetical protein
VQVEAALVHGDGRLVGRRVVIGVGRRLPVRQRRHLATPHRDRGARIEGRLHRRFVGAFADRSLVEVPAAAKPRLRAFLDAPHDRVQLLARRVGRWVEPYARVRIASEHAIVLRELLVCRLGGTTRRSLACLGRIRRVRQGSCSSSHVVWD